MLAAATLLLTLLAPAMVAGGPAASASPQWPDCGARSLYLLLRLEGRSVPFADLQQRRGSPEPMGYSLSQLREAGRTLGLNLVGVELSRTVTALDRPALIYFRRGSHGHFAVVRPVGPRRGIVQVLDPNRDPVVLDAARLSSSPAWTGLALVPRRERRFRAAVASAVGVFLAGSLLRKFLRRPRGNPTVEHGPGAGIEV